MGISPAVSPLESGSRILDADIVGQRHYDIARGVQACLQRYNELKDIIAILGMDELTEEDRHTVHRARRLQRFMSQPVHVAEVFTGMPGRYVPLEETLRSCEDILAGRADHLPEGAFYMVGGLDEAFEKAEKMKGEGW